MRKQAIQKTTCEGNSREHSLYHMNNQNWVQMQCRHIINFIGSAIILGIILSRSCSQLVLLDFTRFHNIYSLVAQIKLLHWKLFLYCKIGLCLVLSRWQQLWRWANQTISKGINRESDNNDFLLDIVLHLHCKFSHLNFNHHREWSTGIQADVRTRMTNYKSTLERVSNPIAV